MLLQSVKRLIARQGFHVTGFTNPLDAIQTLFANPSTFHAVLIDSNMPTMPGLDAAQKIRDLLPNLPIIMISGYLTPQTIDALAAIHIHHFIEKPFRCDLLIRTLTLAISQNPLPISKH